VSLFKKESPWAAKLPEKGNHKNRDDFYLEVNYDQPVFLSPFFILVHDCPLKDPGLKG